MINKVTPNPELLRKEGTPGAQSIGTQGLVGGGRAHSKGAPGGRGSSTLKIMQGHELRVGVGVTLKFPAEIQNPPRVSALGNVREDPAPPGRPPEARLCLLWLWNVRGTPALRIVHPLDPSHLGQGTPHIATTSTSMAYDEKRRNEFSYNRLFTNVVSCNKWPSIWRLLSNVLGNVAQISRSIFTAVTECGDP